MKSVDCYHSSSTLRLSSGRDYGLAPSPRGVNWSGESDVSSWINCRSCFRWEPVVVTSANNCSLYGKANYSFRGLDFGGCQKQLRIFEDPANHRMLMNR
ncbi:hypothetical protein AVEN_256706-1 [Araneus ventricosus]|uniref:Uncharacterized protein n=1 Tax=Araneus ventricosus TaxID=182803 RepID=A0A4Y2RQI7_ARAVE|nr:hypothetical protein AVEN_256706-1 [Araneus ventricosus]